MHTEVVYGIFGIVGVGPYLWTLFDALCFLFVGYILSSFGKYKNVGLHVSFYLCIITCLANILYSRFFDSYIPLNVLGQGGNLPLSELVSYIVDALKVSDSIFLILIIIFESLSGWIEEKKQMSKIMGIAFIPIGLSLYLIALFHIFGNPHFPKAIDFEREAFIPAMGSKIIDSKGVDYNKGIIRGEVLYFFYHRLKPNTLSVAEKARVESFIRGKGKNRSTLHVKDSMNVVIILCESFLSYAAELNVEGNKITPFLDSLRLDTNTLYCSKIKPNVQLGESADGQMIYMTGLLPLKDELSHSYLIGTSFPSLFRNLKNRGYSTHMTLPTQKGMCQQDEMCKVYGIDSLYAVPDFDDGRYHSPEEGAAKWRTDEETFNVAKQEQNHIKPPFAHIILTCTTHSPYDTPKDCVTKCSCRPNHFPKDYSNKFCNYLLACHYMDHQIRNYVAFLKDKGLYDNTLLVIVSDHGVKPQYIDMEESSYGKNMLPLFICNTGINCTKNTKLNQTYNQIDIFPTLIKLLDMKTSWNGLGCSIIDSTNHTFSGVGVEEISSLIIRGKYFVR